MSSAGGGASGASMDSVTSLFMKSSKVFGGLVFIYVILDTTHCNISYLVCGNVAFTLLKILTTMSSRVLLRKRTATPSPDLNPIGYYTCYDRKNYTIQVVFLNFCKKD